MKKQIISNAIVAVTYLVSVLLIDVVHVHITPIDAPYILYVLAATLLIAFYCTNRRVFKNRTPAFRYTGVILLSLILTAIWFSMSFVAMLHFHHAIGGTGP